MPRAAAALALAACAALPAASSATGPARHPWTVPHVLRYATGEDVVGLNPHLNAQLTLAYMSSLTMAWLVRFDERNRPLPELATTLPTQRNGGISRDGRTITYRLRRDARWSDGVPFTSDDVRFSVGVVLNPKNNEQTHQGFDLIDRLDTPDPHTVVFHLKRPHSGFLVDFFSSSGARPCLLPKHLLAGRAEINDAPYNGLPVGIGPFKYAAWRRGDSVEMVPDPLYFGRKPKLQRVVFKIITDRNTVLTQLTTHEIDLWLPVPSAFADRARAVAGVRMIRQPSFGYDHLDLQMQRPVFADPAVRRALRLATDRATIVRKVRRGYAMLEESILSPAYPLHASVGRVPFDIAAANRELDRAGWRRGPDGIRSKNGTRLALEFVSATGAPDADLMIELIRGWWSQIGVSIDVKRYLSTMLFAPQQTGGIVLGGKFDVVTFAWFPPVNGDVTNLFACDRVPPQGQNDPRYCSRDVDRALAALDATYDPSRQRAALRTVQETIARDVPTIVLNAREDLYVFNDDLRAFRPNQASPFDQLADADI